MFEAFLVTTSSEGLQPLGSAAQRSYELISGVLRERLGPDHSALFAEPVAAEHGDRFDWYASFQGKPSKLLDLDPAGQEVVRGKLDRLTTEIGAEANRLGQGSAEEIRLAEALHNALQVPSEAMIYAVEDGQGALHPVLVHWAWQGGAQQSVRGVLTASVPKPHADQIGSGPVSADHPRAFWWLIWLGWLLLLVMLATILWLLVAPCALQPGPLRHCPGERAAWEAAYRDHLALSDEISAINREIALLDRGCQPVIPIQPAPKKEGALIHRFAALAEPVSLSLPGDTELKIGSR
ncbi:hypothetical protein [Primorskyibacter sp. S87]|uniref:hypothetical protein n=1 Tax=Primorskyibacter sp. S87 TaxID=3415126 RepID=UPI003C7D1486